MNTNESFCEFVNNRGYHGMPEDTKKGFYGFLGISFLLHFVYCAMFGFSVLLPHRARRAYRIYDKGGEQ